MGHAYAQSENNDAIQPYHNNPWYWQYKGEPILLIGGSDDDNLWQWTADALTEHLDLLQSVGGNYLRTTMSDRDEGNVYPVQEIESGKYDLEQWNDEYWSRLASFLDVTEARGIIVQLTLWDEFDLYNSEHPLHPANNVNWETGTIEGPADFFGGALRDNNEPVLAYQRRYIDKLMSVALPHDNVIYNIQNESSAGTDWENYWARYLKSAADVHNKDIHITSMQLIPGKSLRHVMTNRDLYSFADVSQNNQNSAGAPGHKHYENLLHWRNMIEAQQEGPMPINNVKVYGAGAGENRAAGTEIQAVERYWRNIFGGAASTRFHRPPGWGIGLSEPAQHTIKVVSMFLEEFDIFNATPYSGCTTLGDKIDADYCLADVGKAYAIYFPFGRSSVVLDPWVYMDSVTVKWLNVTAGAWEAEETMTPNWADVPWWGPERVLVLSPGRGAGGPPDYGSGDAFIAIIEPN